MNAEGANCFLERRADYEKELTGSSDGYVEVNLNACTGTRADGTRGGVEVMPGLAVPDGGAGKIVYTLDQSGLNCLADLVAQANGFDPARQFDLIRDCPQ